MFVWLGFLDATKSYYKLLVIKDKKEKHISERNLLNSELKFTKTITAKADWRPFKSYYFLGRSCCNSF